MYYRYIHDSTLQMCLVMTGLTFGTFVSGAVFAMFVILIAAASPNTKDINNVSKFINVTISSSRTFVVAQSTLVAVVMTMYVAYRVIMRVVRSCRGRQVLSVLARAIIFFFYLGTGVGLVAALVTSIICHQLFYVCKLALPWVSSYVANLRTGDKAAKTAANPSRIFKVAAGKVRVTARYVTFIRSRACKV